MKSSNILLVFAILLISSCGNDNGNSTGADPKPQIDSIQPDSGPVGTSVTISGSGFSATASENEVVFDGTAAEITNASESQLTATVPDGAESGSVVVSVNGVTASGPSFTVEPEAPTITSVEPKNGAVGIEVIIEGKNFSPSASGNTITFNGVQAQVRGAAEDQLLTEVPQGADDGPVEVTVSGKSTTGPEFNVVPVLRNKIVYQGNEDGDYEIIVMDDEGGNPTKLTDNDVADSYPRISPDGTKILFERGDQVYVMNSDGSGEKQLTSDNSDTNTMATWSPDGAQIAFVSTRDGNSELYMMEADGSGVERLTDNPDTIYSPDWSPDGTNIIFISNRDETQSFDSDIFAINVDNQSVTQLTDDIYRISSPTYSKDGTQIAFSTDRDGSSEEIYKISADGSNLTRVTDNAVRDLSPSWSPDGSYLVVRAFDDGTSSYNLFQINASGPGIRVGLTNSQNRESNPHWSPLGN